MFLSGFYIRIMLASQNTLKNISFYFLQEFGKTGIGCFLKPWIQCVSKAIRAWGFLHWKIFNYELDFEERHKDT